MKNSLPAMSPALSEARPPDAVTHTVRQGRPEPVIKVTALDEMAYLTNRQPDAQELEAAAGDAASTIGAGKKQAADAPEKANMITILMSMMRTLVSSPPDIHQPSRTPLHEIPASSGGPQFAGIQQNVNGSAEGRLSPALTVTMNPPSQASSAGVAQQLAEDSRSKGVRRQMSPTMIKNFVLSQLNQANLLPLLQLLRHGVAWQRRLSPGAEAQAKHETAILGEQSGLTVAPDAAGNAHGPLEMSASGEPWPRTEDVDLPPSASRFLEGEMRRNDLIPLVVFLNKNFGQSWAMSGDIAAQMHAAQLGAPELAADLPGRIDIVLHDRLLQPASADASDPVTMHGGMRDFAREMATVQHFHGLALNLFPTGKAFGSLHQKVDIHGIPVMSLPVLIASRKRLALDFDHDDDMETATPPGILYVLGKLLYKSEAKYSGKGKDDAGSKSFLSRLQPKPVQPKRFRKTKIHKLPKPSKHE